jgi:DNA-binding response OmpR family regulator
MMPGLDGFQVLNRIREQYNVPVIMLTARREVTTLQDSLVMGADDFITKPFSILELTARIRAKLRGAGHRELPVSGCYETLSQSEEKTITLSR